MAANILVIINKLCRQKLDAIKENHAKREENLVEKEEKEEVVEDAVNI